MSDQTDHAGSCCLCGEPIAWRMTRGPDGAESGWIPYACKVGGRLAHVTCAADNLETALAVSLGGNGRPWNCSLRRNPGDGQR